MEVYTRCALVLSKNPNFRVLDMAWVVSIGWICETPPSLISWGLPALLVHHGSKPSRSLLPAEGEWSLHAVAGGASRQAAD